MEHCGLTVEIRQKPGYTLITVAGEVDIATAPLLRKRLAGPVASGKPILVDLNAVSFIDASGLGVLASAASRAAAHGASLHPGLRPGPGPAAVRHYRAGPRYTAGPHYDPGVPEHSDTLT